MYVKILSFRHAGEIDMTTTLRIDDKLKHDCEVVLDDLGLSMAGAVTIFLKQVVKQRGIPFAITCDRQSPMDYIVRREVSLSERGHCSFNEKISPPPLRHIANLIQYRRTA
jgi:DNA-damage-inducible protein J